MTLLEALNHGAQFLFSSDSPRLDAEILLANVLETSRAYLIAYPERRLSQKEQACYQAYLLRRQKGEPVAYLVGHKEFWSLDFYVTSAVLIPRPETELLLELLLQLFPEKQGCRKIADLGTGSGAVAISLAKEREFWDIYATDISPEALQLAMQNAKRLGADKVQFFKGAWCQALPLCSFDAIVSNPPYLSSAEWEANLKEIGFEPASALMGGIDGLRDLKEIICCAKNYLAPNGYLMLEHGDSQALAVRQFFEAEGYVAIKSCRDLAGIERVTIGQFL